MAAYKSIRTHNERGVAVTDIFVIASTYSELFNHAAATEINAVDITETSDELKAGIAVSNSAKFSANENLALSVADTDCIALLLTAVENATVYVARFINPNDPATESDFCFIGTVDKKITKKDLAWNSSVFATTTNAVAAYGFSASSFDASVLLSKKVEELVRDSEDESTINVGWIASNVADRLAYFNRNDAGIIRQTKFANLVSLQSLLQYLLDEAEEGGISITYAESSTTIMATPAFFLPMKFADSEGNIIRYLRYCDDLPNTGIAPKPFHLIGGQSVQLKTGGTGTGAPYVSLRLIDPNENEKSLSWLGLSLIELLGKLALCFGSVLRVTYTATNAVQISMQTVEDFTSATFLFGDAVDSGSDISLTIAEQSDKGLNGVAYMLANEGTQYYIVDDVPKQIYPKFVPPNEGENLPVTISPTWAFLRERGDDAGYNLAEKWGRALIPHNCVFYDQNQVRGTAIEYNTTAIHTGLYLQTIGLPDIASGEVGVQGFATWRPIGQIWAKVDNQLRYFSELAPYIQVRQTNVASYSERTRKITVAGLCHFKEDVAASEDWRAVKVGYVTTIDGEDFVCTKVVRKKTETDIELVRKIEFHDDELPDIGEITDVPTNAFPIGLPTNERSKKTLSYPPVTDQDIAQFSVVGLDDTGRIFKMHATAEHYGKQLGIATESFAWETDNPEKAIPVQTTGEIYLGANALTAFPFPPNSRLFLRNGTTNFSNIPPANVNGENLVLEIGRLSPDGTAIIIDFKGNGAIFEGPGTVAV